MGVIFKVMKIISHGNKKTHERILRLIYFKYSSFIIFCSFTDIYVLYTMLSDFSFVNNKHYALKGYFKTWDTIKWSWRMYTYSTSVDRNRSLISSLCWDQGNLFLNIIFPFEKNNTYIQRYLFLYFILDFLF